MYHAVHIFWKLLTSEVTVCRSVHQWLNHAAQDHNSNVNCWYVATMIGSPLRPTVSLELYIQYIGYIYELLKNPKSSQTVKFLIKYHSFHQKKYFINIDIYISCSLFRNFHYLPLNAIEWVCCVYGLITFT